MQRQFSGATEQVLGLSRITRLVCFQTPNTIPGLRAAHNFGGVLGSLHGEDGCATTKSLSQQSSPSSDESNSPTELNSYKRLADKPPLIKRLAMGLTGNDATSRLPLKRSTAPASIYSPLVLEDLACIYSAN